MNLSTALRLASWLLIGSALSLAVFAGSNAAYDITSQNELSAAWDQAHRQTAKANPALGPADAFQLNVQRPRLAVGQPLAKITVPSIQWHGVVLEGNDDKVLAGGPGHLVGSAYPGEPDNVVISNHNTYSMQFANLKAGEQIVLDTDYGHYAYRVTGFKIISATDSSVTAHTGKAQLTFTTCYPLWQGAFAKQRYVISADLVTQ